MRNWIGNTLRTAGGTGIDMVTWRKRWSPDDPERSAREKLRDFLNEISFTHRAFGPSRRNPEHGIEVEASGGSVNITQWDLTEPPDDEDYKKDWEERPVLKMTTSLDLTALLDPAGKHRGSYSRDEELDVREFPFMGKRKVKEAVINAALSYLAYYGGSEEWVSEVGE